MRIRNCFSLNFGWSHHLTLPQMKISPGQEISLSVEMMRTTAPSHCFVVMVGEKYLKKMNEIIATSRSLAERLGTRPIMYFVESNSEKDYPVLSSYTNSPLMVFYQNQIIKYLQIYLRFLLANKKSLNPALSSSSSVLSQIRSHPHYS